MHICSTVCALRDGFLGEPVGEIGMDVAVRQLAGPWVAMRNEIGGARSIEQQERAEHGRDQDRAAVMRLDDLLQRARIGLARFPIRRLRPTRPSASRNAEPRPGRLAELLRKLAEQALAVQVAARPRDLVAQHARIGEMLEQGDDVGERLVEGVDIGIARLVEARMHAVEQRVRHLVRDDVVREAGEHRVARRVVGVLAPAPGK